jgi:5-bromo-4-chloroindolyl phosphate hydrolysis protein
MKIKKGGVMKKLNVFCFLALAMIFVLFFAHDVVAKNYYLDPDIEKRIQNQQNRIEAGISSGQLTRDEARALKNNLHHIQEEAVNLQADGRLSSSEKQRLNAVLDRNSEMIQDKRQNPITAVAPGAGVERDHQIRDIIARQQTSINEGVRSGQLTAREAQTLNNNLNHIRDEEARWRTFDGRLSEDARDRLMAMLEENGRMIRNKKTNPITAFGQVVDESNPAVLRIDQRIYNQQNRIDNGIRSGNLTREEARTLRSNLQYIMEQSKGIKKDGVITNAERSRLNALLDQNSYMIQDKKTNPIRQAW